MCRKNIVFLPVKTSNIFPETWERDYYVISLSQESNSTIFFVQGTS